MKKCLLHGLFGLVLSLAVEQPAICQSSKRPAEPRMSPSKALLDSIGRLNELVFALEEAKGRLNDTLRMAKTNLRREQRKLAEEREAFQRQRLEFLNTIEKLGGTDWPSILIGGAIAVGATLITLLFQYWHGMRNRLFKEEFKIQLNLDKANTNADQVVNADLSVVVFSSGSEKVRINYAYIEIPNDVKINAPSFAALGDQMFGHGGKFYIMQLEKAEVDGILYQKIPLNHQAILRLINERRLRKIQFVVHTTKYGLVKSSPIQI